jgi:acyl-CoA reductase-like NAD-dependent aldehyde dehydrogenase
MEPLVACRAPVARLFAMDMLRDIDPATGELIAEIPVTSPDQVIAAVARARAAADEWADIPFDARAELLLRVADRFDQRQDELAQLVTREMGKPFAEARREASARSKELAGVIETARRALAVEDVSEGSSRTHVVRDPLGVVAAITPWNFPLAMPTSILLPALATGNTVVFKPSEHVPLCGAVLAEIIGGDLPDGVLELVQGAGETGAQLVDADVDMVGFVGSRATGQKIMRAAGGGLKRLVLELGGKDPLIVFADADLDAAAECAVTHSLRNAGQVCCSVERVFVEASVREEFERLVLAKASSWTHGSGFEPESRMGPMVDDAQRAKVHAQVEDAVARGARLLLGGTLLEGPGSFYPATVLADVPDSSVMATEETFGPVVSLSAFDGDEAEAVRLANATRYGLGANVYTGDGERGLRVARRIRSGQVGVNRYLAGSSRAPWVGARESGFGFLGGVEGYRQFTVPKSISIASGG